MARYGPGGTYWGAPYHQKYGASAPTLPVQSWQIWNEPNLKKFFSPGSTTQPVGPKVRRPAGDLPRRDQGQGLHSARSCSPGCPAPDDSKAWDFLNALYDVAGVKNDFDVAALHPYGCDLDESRSELKRSAPR